MGAYKEAPPEVRALIDEIAAELATPPPGRKVIFQRVPKPSSYSPNMSTVVEGLVNRFPGSKTAGIPGAGLLARDHKT